MNKQKINKEEEEEEEEEEVKEERRGKRMRKGLGVDIFEILRTPTFDIRYRSALR